MRRTFVLVTLLLACSQQRKSPPAAYVAATTSTPLARWCDADIACGLHGHCEFGVCEDMEQRFESASAARWHSEACWSAPERRVIQALTPHGDACVTLEVARDRCDHQASSEDCLGAAVLLHLSGDERTALAYFTQACRSGLDAACKRAE